MGIGKVSAGCAVQKLNRSGVCPKRHARPGGGAHPPYRRSNPGAPTQPPCTSPLKNPPVGEALVEPSPKSPTPKTLERSPSKPTAPKPPQNPPVGEALVKAKPVVNVVDVAASDSEVGLYLWGREGERVGDQLGRACGRGGF